MSKRVTLTMPRTMSGAARVFDMGVTLNRKVQVRGRDRLVRSPERDVVMLARDWRAIGRDLGAAAARRKTGS